MACNLHKDEFYSWCLGCTGELSNYCFSNAEEDLQAAIQEAEALTAATSKHDPVAHPSHYTSHPSGIECIKITRHMNFNLGNVVKYIWRAGLKDSAPSLQDLEKAAWYLADEIARIRKVP